MIENRILLSSLIFTSDTSTSVSTRGQVTKPWFHRETGLTQVLAQASKFYFSLCFRYVCTPIFPCENLQNIEAAKLLVSTFVFTWHNFLMLSIMLELLLSLSRYQIWLSIFIILSPNINIQILHAFLFRVSKKNLFLSISTTFLLFRYTEKWKRLRDWGAVNSFTDSVQLRCR